MNERRFNLETALAAWRRFLTSAHAISVEDADELESHLRDEIEAEIAQGWTEERAFRQAVRQLGDYATLERAYRQVYWKKLRAEHRVMHELNGRLSMLKNYLKIALRQVRRNKGHAVLNVFGLALGLVCCLFIFLYVRHEASYDRYHRNADRIVRLIEDVHTENQTLYQATSSPAMGHYLFQDYPAVRRVVRFQQTTGLMQYSDRRFVEDHIVYADSTVFEVFDFSLLRGDPETALAAPFSVVLSESVARTYFGDEDPLGKTLLFENEYPLTVTGVLADVPRTSHLFFDIMISFTTREAWNSTINENWGWNNFYTYVLLPEDYDPAQLEAELPGFLERHVGDWLRSRGFSYTLTLQPLTDIYLHSHRSWEAGPTGNPTNLYLFSAIALFILLIACVNFINLATARSAARAKEVGLRKVVGAQRGQLAVQFLGESLLTSLLALLGALGLFRLLLPLFDTLTGVRFSFAALWTDGTAFFALGLILAVGLAAGLYPALVLSGFRPATVLRGAFSTSPRGLTLRRGLVVFQFAVSIILIVGAAVVAVQLDYVRNQRRGFEAEQQLVIDFDGDRQVQQQAETVRAAFLAHPAVVAASFSSSVPGVGTVNNLLAHVEVAPGQIQEAALDNFWVDEDFIETLGIELVAGRGFSRDVATDATEAFVINEAAVAHFGWASPEEALGKRFERGNRTGTIIGVVRDFNYRSLRQRVDPLFLMMAPGGLSVLTLRVQTAQLARTVAEVEEIWEQVAPQRPFLYTFLDESFNAQYESEERFGDLFGTFALLAIFIACLGLFGLASFTVQERTKEIGVRKVLGASVGQILMLLSKEFTKLVVVAFVVATPVAYAVMNTWLDTFAYRIEISWPIFLMAGLAALGIALLTVSYQSIRAALTDPVNSLRYE